MAIHAQRASEIVLGTLGVDELDDRASLYEIINGAIGWVERLSEWRFLERGQTALSIVKDQPWIELPPDVRSITGYNATRSFVNTLTFSEAQTVLRLRTARYLSSTLHLNAAPQYIPAPQDRDEREGFQAGVAEYPSTRVNLLARTEQFGDALWTTEPSTAAVVTANQGQGPLNARVDADSIDGSVTGSSVQQSVNYRLLRDGTYVFSVYIKKDASVTHATDISAVSIQQNSLGTFTTALVDWSGAQPTLTTFSGSQGVASMSILGGGWVRVEVPYTYDLQGAGTGALECIIKPVAVSGTGAIFAWGAQCERTLGTRFSEINIDGTSVAATSYVPVLGSTPANGGPPRPVLMVWPIPQTTELGKLSITYRARIPRVGDDSDQVSIPDWLEDLFREALILYARGWQEEDSGFLHQRLDALRQSSMVMDCIDIDADMFPDVGPMEGGHVQASRVWINWDTGKTTALP